MATCDARIERWLRTAVTAKGLARVARVIRVPRGTLTSYLAGSGRLGTVALVEQAAGPWLGTNPDAMPTHAMDDRERDPYAPTPPAVPELQGGRRGR